MNKNIIILLLIIFILSGCDDLFTPAIENNVGLSQAETNASYAYGLLLNGYTRIPTDSWSFNDVATDDAVSNDDEDDYLEVANGGWTSSNDPFSKWSSAKAAIQYINLFLSLYDEPEYASDEDANRMFKIRLRGEAYGLRAMYMYYLLQSHAGYTDDGSLLGVPVVLEPEDATTDFNYPRNTFDDCMEQFYLDIDSAETLLPLDYEDIADDSEVPEKYGDISVDVYNRVFGDAFRLLMTKRIAMGIKAQAALLAASPAYNSSNDLDKWGKAANYAGDVLDLIGGVSGLDANGYTWYDNQAEIDAVASGVNPDEILWRGGISDNNTIETNNYPPTLYGNGEINPTQNLVDAFPMANGYPIDNASSSYDASDPYLNRDPRLQTYIVVNGSTEGPNNTAIYTSTDGGTNDGLNAIETSTRTGYYMRKLLRQDISITSTSSTTQNHYTPRIRYTEIFLIYAEAANEAWGPNTDGGGHGYSAYDVIKAIRERAGVGTDNDDPYLESIKSDQDAMRELIRNERRLELCFEGFRFWDLRRWNVDLSKLNEIAKGVSITKGVHTEINVENRVYKDYMYHGPIPSSEILKYNALIQNKGW